MELHFETYFRSLPVFSNRLTPKFSYKVNPELPSDFQGYLFSDQLKQLCFVLRMALILRLIISRWRWKFMRKFMVNSGNYYITNQVLKTQKIKHRNRMSFPNQFKPSPRWNIHELSKIPFTFADRPVWYMKVASQSIDPHGPYTLKVLFELGPILLEVVHVKIYSKIYSISRILRIWINF